LRFGGEHLVDCRHASVESNVCHCQVSRDAFEQASNFGLGRALVNAKPRAAGLLFSARGISPLITRPFAQML